jgi:hypothetical protein
VTTIQRTRQPGQGTRGSLMWLFYLCDAGLLVTSGLMAGTMVGFVLARTVGIFGFRLTFSSGLADTVLVVEAVAVVLLAVTGCLQLTRKRAT